jgi:hypothetical protein
VLRISIVTHRHITQDMTHLEHAYVRCVCVWENVSWGFAPRIFKLSEDTATELQQSCNRAATELQQSCSRVRPEKLQVV